MTSNSIKVLSGSQDLRDRMPRGAIALLAAKYGKSWVWIYRVVTGLSNGNPAIIEDAQRLAEVGDETREKIKSALTNVNQA